MREESLSMVRRHGKRLGTRPLCDALGVPRATYYRVQKSEFKPPKARSHPRRIPDEQRAEIRSVLNSEPFCDMAPASVFTSLLDEGQYMCSERSMYRILDEVDQNQPRRQRPARNLVKPELLATGPNQVWSWDISKLKGPVKWTYYYLYKIMDIYSRYVVGWMIADRENATLARDLIAETCRKQNINQGTLLLHSDNGGPMTAQCVAKLLADLGITRSLSRPHVSNDNPYSESAFKTLKYKPGLPERYKSQEQTEAIFTDLMHWYNCEHYHSGIGMLTPYQVHYGLQDVVLNSRLTILQQAYERNPERFVRGCPVVRPVPQAVWINKPYVKEQTASESSLNENQKVSHIY
jgi:putative transposase